MSLGLTLRAATPAEEPAALRLMEAFYAEEHLHFEPTQIGRALHELLTDPQLGWFLLVEVEERIAGYVVLLKGFILEFGGRQVFVDELYLKPEARGRGLGRAVLEAAAERCREAGIRVMRLEVDTQNKRARRLYEGVGFQLHERSTMTRRLDAEPTV